MVSVCSETTVDNLFAKFYLGKNNKIFRTVKLLMMFPDQGADSHYFYGKGSQF